MLQTHYREKAADMFKIERQKWAMRHAMTEDLEDHVQRQYLALLALFGTEDFREGLASFLEKRPADFKGQ